MKFGCHLSIRDGYLAAANHALAIQASAFQYFPKNPRSLSIKNYDAGDAGRCREYCFGHHIISVAHTPYPTNLTPAEKKQERLISSLLNDLEIADSCGSIGAVVHFGNQTSSTDPLSAYQLIIETLNRILAQWKGKCKLLLENNAGPPGSFGTTLEEMVQVRNLSSFPDKIGFCLDTCHAFASGIWNGENTRTFLDRGTALEYFDGLEVVHLNNSLYPAGQGKDRHANIFSGGYITEEQMHSLLSAPVLRQIPCILETPKNSENGHEQEIMQLNKKWGMLH
ncbi:Endonuclease IV [Bacillus sp. OV322]|uniref:deoxyribonuclease IV n=1 Tax=Bacillus sp. OV322 TaxID=1882764 RepID=UPI0008EA9774|nr:deoxyribonuclease IV [Bacillus sp. OV322]SFC69093.1 Endonuclease IV [Bacillus sp. OV322]